ncbi:MAG: cyanophycinase, partial [Bacteroidetes bacterium]|nr:cyanophycinase [Bacteroidota bacterium]
MTLRIINLFIVFIFSLNKLHAQAYTSYYTGNTQNVNVTGQGGICMMGGATEDDEAMKWFLRRANGGDILVLRASGSDGYNDYLYSQLGISVNSVETIVFNDASAANNSYVKQKINRAEGIWFAGGDQWNYVSYFRNTPVDSIIRARKINSNIVIGGTSAGMAILGQAYFTAQNGTVYSDEALANPYSSAVTVDTALFLENNFLQNTITDTHFDDPDRKGRLTVFMARMVSDYSMDSRAIACDEYTAVCIDENGIASVFGGWPTYDDNAYFIQINCENEIQEPENCQPGQPLTWDRNASALKVYNIKGTSSGINTFDLNTWLSGEGGSWQNWSVQNGVLNENESNTPDCMPLMILSDSNDLTIQLTKERL